MIRHGNLFDVLPTLDAECCHACVTDPPYGIGFMGREWDTFGPDVAAKKQGLRQINKSELWSEREQRKAEKRQINPNLRGRTVDGAISSSQIDYDQSAAGLRRYQEWTEQWAREVFRVLKPGAHLVVCGAPRSHHRMFCGIEDAGFEIRDCLAWIFGQGFPKSKNLGHGWGTALKPGHEPILLARKPFRGSTQHCHDAHGTAGLNIDACRIDVSRSDAEARHARNGNSLRESACGYSGGWHGDHSPRTGIDVGRWPANVLLDEDAAVLLDEQSGDRPTGKGSGASWGQSAGTHEGWKRPAHANYQPHPEAGYGDSGGASRFFYMAKPSRNEREAGFFDASRGNIHPTVKPLALMRWLVRLVTPAGGVVLDPFGGSGTTAMACAAEGFDFVLIEREAAYIPILEARIRSVAPLFTETSA